MKINKTRPNTNRSPRRLVAGLVATALGLPLAATSASAVLGDPAGPTAPHSIIVFPSRDFVHLDGYDQSPVTMNVLRGGVVVGTTGVFTPDQPDPATPGKFMADINHLGAPCWVGVTPDIRGGDLIQVLTAPGQGDDTTTAGVTVTLKASPDPANPTTGVIVKGTAVSATGGQIPIAQLESRIVANKQLFASPGAGRTLRASSIGPLAGKFEGHLAYDTATATTWTATFPNLTGVNPIDSISDFDRALGAETRGQWLGRNPLAVNENTIYEWPGGVIFGGPAPGCLAPAATGPAVHMTPASDTGISSTDGITSNASPTFIGATSLPTSNSVNIYVGGVLAGSSAVTAGAFSYTPTTPLAEGLNAITAGEVGPSLLDPTITTETLGNAPVSAVIDTLAPVTTSSPVASATGVSQSAAITATFSENVQGVSGTTFMLNTSAGTAVAAVVSYDAATHVATLNPTAPLAAGNGYVAAVTAGITDVAGNPVAATSWSFTTAPPVGGGVPPAPPVGGGVPPAPPVGGGVPPAPPVGGGVPPAPPVGGGVTTGLQPTVTAKSPAANAIRVVQAGNTNAKFSEDVAGVNGATFTLKKPGAVRVAAAVSYNATTHVATLNPTATLAAGTRYTATLTSGIKDADGNPIAATSWSFTTGPRPTVLRKSPAASALGVRRLANATATFSENVHGVSRAAFTLKKSGTGVAVAATVSYNATTHVATLNPGVTLAANTRYTATLRTFIKDADGNSISAMSWSFTTGR